MTLMVWFQRRAGRSIRVTMFDDDIDLQTAKDFEVGPTTVYSFMQSVGIVNDHLDGCFRRADVERERSRFKRPT